MPWQDDNKGQSGDRNRKNPWGQPENSRPNDPWMPGRGRSGGDGPSPDIDEILRKARQNFRNAVPGNGGPVKLAALGALVLAALWMVSGFYFIQPNEHGVVLTFGKYTRTDTDPGLKYRLPSPVQSVIVVPVTVERRTAIGFADATQAFRGQPQTASAEESLMLTGDQNIIDINFVVSWRIGDARDYLFSIRDPEDTVKIVAQSAMREIIGQTKIQAALTEAREQIQIDTRKLMQSILDEYKSGVVISQVQLQKVDPPGEVVDAFNDVQRARQQKESLRNEAEKYRNDIIPRAKGEAERLRQQAQAYQQEVVNRAKGDAERFNQVYNAYRNSKTVTAERMYLETIEGILQNAKVVYLGSDKGQSVLPYLQLNGPAKTVPAPVVATPDQAR